VWFSHL